MTIWVPTATVEAAPANATLEPSMIPVPESAIVTDPAVGAAYPLNTYGPAPLPENDVAGEPLTVRLFAATPVTTRSNVTETLGSVTTIVCGTAERAVSTGAETKALF